MKKSAVLPIGILLGLSACSPDETPMCTDDASAWTQHAYLKTSHAARGEHVWTGWDDVLNGDQFGFAVALSADGRTLAVAAPLEPESFERDDDRWRLAAELSGDGHTQLGRRLAISGDGDTLAVACGHAVSISVEEGLMHTTYAPGVEVYARQDGAWTLEDSIDAPEGSLWFGNALALSGDGTTLVVGDPQNASESIGVDGEQTDPRARYAGAVFVYDRAGADWVQQAFIRSSNAHAEDDFGDSLALSASGGVLAIGARRESGADGPWSIERGAVYVFRRDEATWSQDIVVTATREQRIASRSTMHFGQAVALSADGTVLAVGAQHELDPGVVYLFECGADACEQAHALTAINPGADDGFGTSIAMSGDARVIVVGALREDSAERCISIGGLDDDAPGSGAVYAYVRSGGEPYKSTYIKAPNADRGDRFGHALALSGQADTLAVSAPFEDSSALGIGAVVEDDDALNAGVVYVYRHAPLQ